MRSRLILALLLSLPLICAAQSQKDSPDPNRTGRNPIDGAKVYQYYCATCHGSDARGHGPAAVALKGAVPDLTLISQRNRGKFPYQRIKETIAGKQSGPTAHGNREMPVWGPIFHEIEADQDWGEVRLDAVTKYLKTIQQK